MTPAERMTRWFEFDFWPLYPRKVAKKTARKAALKVLPGKIPADIVAGLKAQLPKFEAMVPAGDIVSVPHAGTWLNAHRWEGEPEPARVAVAVMPDRYSKARTVTNDAIKFLGESGHANKRRRSGKDR